MDSTRNFSSYFTLKEKGIQKGGIKVIPNSTPKGTFKNEPNR
jgi:hypothetical protein